MTPSSATTARTDALGTRVLGNHQRTLLAAASIAGTLLLWGVFSSAGWVDHVLLPSPLEVLTSLLAAVSDGSLLRHVTVSLLRVLEGFALALAAATAICAARLGSLAVPRAILVCAADGSGMVVDTRMSNPVITVRRMRFIAFSLSRLIDIRTISTSAAGAPLRAAPCSG